MPKKEFNVDQGFAQLDKIIEQLEKDDVKLADAVQLYTKGVEVVNQCKGSLDQVEKQLQILDSSMKDGES